MKCDLVQYNTPCLKKSCVICAKGYLPKKVYEINAQLILKHNKFMKNKKIKIGKLVKINKDGYIVKAKADDISMGKVIEVNNFKKITCQYGKKRWDMEEPTPCCMENYL